MSTYVYTHQKKKILNYHCLPIIHSVHAGKEKYSCKEIYALTAAWQFSVHFLLSLTLLIAVPADVIQTPQVPSP